MRSSHGVGAAHKVAAMIIIYNATASFMHEFYDDSVSVVVRVHEEEAVSKCLPLSGECFSLPSIVSLKTL